MSLKNSMESYWKAILKEAGKDEAQRELVSKRQKQAKELEEFIKDCDSASLILNTYARKVQEEVHLYLEELVSAALSIVFDEPYEFHISRSDSLTKSEARMLFRRNKMLVDPMDAAGGGVVDVAAFALRLGCILLQKGTPRLLILDEPFKFVSKNYLPRVQELLHHLSSKYEFRIIMVTHLSELETGEVIRLGD